METWNLEAKAKVFHCEGGQVYGERGKGSLHATIIMGFSIFYTLIRVDAVRRLEAAAAAQDGALDSGPAEAVTAAKHNNNMMMGRRENGTASWSGVESVAVEIKLSIRTGWRTVMMMMVG